tara:strand:- start:561 stop:1007 length:447 start_codon:yes stop_codon:yes gene_type:complete
MGNRQREEEERLCQRLFFPNKKKVSVFCSLLRERTRDDNTKSRSGIFFFETTFIIIVISSHSIEQRRRRQRREKDREREQFVNTDVLEAVWGKTRGGVKTTHHHHHHHGPRLEWRGRRNREANKRFAEESGGRNHGASSFFRRRSVDA